jgi:alkylation response protein AidB-like acyl-CoA dehydrogenase
MSETTTDLETFRSETRTWLQANCPPEMRQPAKTEADVCWGGKRFKFQSEAQRQWLQRMGERGWTVPTWPREYGGGGLSHAEATILREEMAALRCRVPLQSFPDAGPGC